MKPSLNCASCGSPTDLVCKDCGIGACLNHINIIRQPGHGWGCHHGTFVSVHELAQATYGPFWQQKVVIQEEPLKATNKNEATKEGKTFARLLGGLVEKKQNPDFETVADFAQILAVDVFGYGGAELANAWTRGFIAQWTSATPAAAPADLSGVDPVELALQLLNQAKQQQPLLQEKNGE